MGGFTVNIGFKESIWYPSLRNRGKTRRSYSFQIGVDTVRFTTQSVRIISPLPSLIRPQASFGRSRANLTGDFLIELRQEIGDARGIVAEVGAAVSRS